MQRVHGQTAKIIYRSSPDGKLFIIKNINIKLNSLIVTVQH